MKTFITACAIGLALTGPAFAASSDILAKDIETRVVQNIGGYTKVSVRMEVMNYAEPAKVYISYRALDFSGYELASGIVTDTFQKYDTKTLTNTEIIKNDVYNQINKWEVKQIAAYPTR